MRRRAADLRASLDGRADVDAAARTHSAAFGSGPFFVARHVPLVWSRHRGIERVHLVAAGQADVRDAVGDGDRNPVGHGTLLSRSFAHR